MSERAKKKGAGMSLMAHLAPSKLKEVVINNGESYRELAEEMNPNIAIFDDYPTLRIENIDELKKDNLFQQTHIDQDKRYEEKKR